MSTKTGIFAVVLGFMLGAGMVAAGSAPAASGANVPIPKGWRIPTARETHTRGPGAAFPSGLVISGDFDGDGGEDKAMLLVAADGSRYGLFVFLAEQSGFRTERLFERDVRGLRNVSIRRVRPGRYLTPCGQGYYACAKGEARDIKIEHDAIDEYDDEGAEVYYYWDSKTNSFGSLQMSD